MRIIHIKKSKFGLSLLSRERGILSSCPSYQTHILQKKDEIFPVFLCKITLSRNIEFLLRFDDFSFPVEELVSLWAIC